MLIHADASPSIGAGHVMRCLALAGAAQKACVPVRMIGRVRIPWVRQRIADEGISFSPIDARIPERENSEELLRRLEGNHAKTTIALDGYHFGADCQKAVRAAGYTLLVIDDHAHLPEYSCDILLNQNIGSEELKYAGDIGKKLLGPQYALLRPGFHAARQRAEARKFSGKVRNILLTLGGGDFSDHLARIAPDFTLPAMAGHTLRVIAGAMPQERIRELLRDCPARLEVLGRVDDMPALLADTDLCVTAGGSTCWELCCLGVPFLTLNVAENQHTIVHGLQRRNIAPLYTRQAFAFLIEDGQTRRIYAEAGSALVDGLGAKRVVQALLR